MSQRKIIFLAIVGAIALALFIGALLLGGEKKAPVQTSTTPDSLSVWVVGDDTAGYSAIAEAFKKAAPQYANTRIEFTKFADYGNYESVLLNALADGVGPDIITLSSDGSALLSGKTVDIPSTYIPDFSTRFSEVFADLIVRKSSTDENGKEVIINDIRGVPLGYETMGIFYNRNLIRRIPRDLTWDVLDQEIANIEENGDTGIGLGLGSVYTQNIGDLLRLFFIQNGIYSGGSLGEPGARAALEAYVGYNSGNIQILREEMDALDLTLTDMFARGKVAMLIGYPSLIREIDYAIKRAGESTISLYTAPIAQIPGGKNTNLVRYKYFAISRAIESERQAAAADFLAFLSTTEADMLYVQNFPTYLPALSELESAALENTTLSPNHPNALLSSFLVDKTTFIPFDAVLSADFDTALLRLTSGSGIDTSRLLPDITAYMICRTGQLLSASLYDEICTL